MEDDIGDLLCGGRQRPYVASVTYHCGREHLIDVPEGFNLNRKRQCAVVYLANGDGLYGAGLYGAGLYGAGLYGADLCSGGSRCHDRKRAGDSC
jgi:hypothetical protein